MIKQWSFQKHPALLECIFQGRTENKQVSEHTGEFHLVTQNSNKVTEMWLESRRVTEIKLRLRLEWQNAQPRGRRGAKDLPADWPVIPRSYGRNKQHTEGREGRALWLVRGGESKQQMRSRWWEHWVRQIKESSFDSELEAKTGCSKIHTTNLPLKF